MMVGRTVFEATPELPEQPDPTVMLEVRHLNRGRQVRDISFQLHRGEILGFAGLVGAGRTEVVRAIFARGHAGIRRDPRQRRAGHDPDAGRRRRPRDRLPLRGPQAVRPRARAWTSRSTSSSRPCGRFTNRFGWVEDGSHPAEGRGARRHAGDQDPAGHPAGEEPVGRQPAEGGHREMADRRHARS